MCWNIYNDSNLEVKKLVKNNMIEIHNSVRNNAKILFYDESLLQKLSDIALILDLEHELMCDLS